MAMEIALLPLVGIEMLIRIVVVASTKGTAFPKLVARRQKIDKEPVAQQQAYRDGKRDQNAPQPFVPYLLVHPFKYYANVSYF